MRSNLKTIGQISTDWKSEFQGVLCIKDKKSTYNDHWAKLKGNLLMILKTGEGTCEEIFGIVLMEYFEVEVNEDSQIPYSLKITFESGDQPIIFGFKTKTEFSNWESHLKSAKNKGFAKKLQAMKNVFDSDCSFESKLSKLSLTEEPIEEIKNKGDQSGLNISISCQNLPFYSYDVEPNPSVSAYIYDPKSQTMKPHSVTEIVYHSRNPNFNKVIFVHQEYYNPKYYVKFIVYDVRDAATSLRHKIGSANFCISSILNNSVLEANLICDNPDVKNCGILKLDVQELKSQISLMESRVDVRMYHKMVENNLVRSYGFPRANGKHLKIIEMMGESVFGFPVALEFLRKLLEEESLIQESLTRYATSDNYLQNLRTDLQIIIRDKRHKYETLFSAMSQMSAEGQTFRTSCRKTDMESSFIPLNLHINRIYVNNDNTNDMDKYHDIVTVGAFAAHPMKFKGNYGLYSIARQLPESLGVLQRNSTLLTADSMLRDYVRFNQDIINQLRHLCSFINYPADVKQDENQLTNKLKKYNKFYQHIYFNSLSLNQIRRDHVEMSQKISEYVNCKDMNAADSHILAIQECSRKMEVSLEELGQLTINILWSKILHGLNNAQMIFEWNEFVFRENLVFSQALATVLTGLSVSISKWSTSDWQQMIVCGVPLYFEALLSSYSDEIGMLDDMRWTIERLKFIKIFIRPNQNKTPGFHINNMNSIDLYCNELIWKMTPVKVRLKARVRLHLHPYLFNVGINEFQTLSDKISKSNILQQINFLGYQSMKAYYDMLVKHISIMNVTCRNAEIIDKLNDLKYELDRNRSKPVEVFDIVEEVSWAWKAIRFTSCKSAKDRTGMAVTLEQIRWLKYECDLHPDYFTKALDCIRLTGLRRDNCFKNTGTNRYAFNGFQLLSIPKLYKPPAGSYGGNET